MTQEELDNKISTLRMEKLMLIKSKERVRDIEKKLGTEKRITEVNNEMKKLREQFKKDRLKEKENKNERN